MSLYLPAAVTQTAIDGRGGVGKRFRRIYRLKINGLVLDPWFFGVHGKIRAITEAKKIGAEVVHHELKKSWITDWRPE